MWKKLIRLSEESACVIAKLPVDEEVSQTFSTDGLQSAISELNVSTYYYDEDAATQFVHAAKKKQKQAHEGVVIAYRKDSKAEVILSESDMLATMVITGPFGGKKLSSVDIIQALAKANVTKGINKLALKKVLAQSAILSNGESFEQPVAAGMQPVNGKDSQFVPLVEDLTQRVLKPQVNNSKTDKVDMRDLGELATVAQNEAVLKRIPATKGKHGYTVLGVVIPPKPGNDQPLKEGKGSYIDKNNPNLLRASIAGIPIIKKNTIDVDPSLTLKNVDVTTGHIKFKGSLVISGNIEAGMIVRATGSVTVGGFIESADVQAQEDIIVGKGIIGHAVEEGEEKVCIVKTNGNLTSKYAQFAHLQAAGDINLDIHCMSCDVKCTGNLTVKDEAMKQGTLSGGVIRVGGKVDCYHLGVEGDTATYVEAFARYRQYKQGLVELKERYKLIQEKTMDVIRREMEYMKTPKSERLETDIEKIREEKEKNNTLLLQAKNKIESAEAELQFMLKENSITAEKVYTRVTIQYGDEKYLTKQEKGQTVFTFDQYQIDCKTMVEGVEESS